MSAEMDYVWFMLVKKLQEVIGSYGPCRNKTE